MAQHFLLSAQSRTLSLKAIYQGGEEKAYETFRKLRWPETDGEPICSECGCIEAKPIKNRPTFRCIACNKHFTVTSGTMFASRKLSFMDLLAAICLFVNGSKGMSAVQLSRDLDVQYKTAFVMAHKLREALAAETADATLAGEVEIDGAHFQKTPRQENRVEDRVDRRIYPNRGSRRVVVALRQRKGRTLTFVRRSEADGVSIARARMAAYAHVFADEATHWDALEMQFRSSRINHSEAYSDGNGKHTNWVESYFSRLRRMVIGQHHQVSHKYLYQYANHAAWLEDHRCRSNGGNAMALLGGALNHPASRVWGGYWQRAKNA